MQKVKPDLPQIRLEGELTIRRAAALKQRLLEALDAHEVFCLSFAEINKVDLSFFQLLCAACRSCAQEKKRIHLQGEVPRLVQLSARRLGFCGDSGCRINTAECLCAQLGVPAHPARSFPDR